MEYILWLADWIVCITVFSITAFTWQCARRQHKQYIVPNIAYERAVYWRKDIEKHRQDLQYFQTHLREWERFVDNIPKPPQETEFQREIKKM